MFRDLTNFDKQRTISEAIGFYVSYAALGVAIAGIIGVFLSPLPGIRNDLLFVARLGEAWAILYCVVLSALITVKKSLGFLGSMIAVLSGILAIALGVVGGLIATAFLTTRPNSKELSEQHSFS